METKQSLKGKRALVTGGSRGIGAAIAARLKNEGATVAITATKQVSGGEFECFAVDFSDEAALTSFANGLGKLRFDILINNAGINKIAPFTEIETADFERIQRVNVLAPFLLAKACLGHMRASRWGRIVNVSSVFGIVARAQRGAYATSKFALDGMTAALAAEVAKDGVLANCVAPGFVDTELTRQILGEKGMQEAAASVPMGRLARPEEIAAFVAWLAGPENTYISGQNLAIDGGFTRV